MCLQSFLFGKGVHQQLKIASSNGNAFTTSSFQSWTGHRVVENLFLKDYTRYSTLMYFFDCVTIPKERFKAYAQH
jgi:hypothetical protein